MMKKAELLDTLQHSHGYNFRDFASGFGVAYKLMDRVSAVSRMLSEHLQSGSGPLVIEFVTDGVLSANNIKSFT